MGHEVAATPIQMTMAMAAIANGGRLMRPLLVKNITDAEGRSMARIEPQVRVQAVSRGVARSLTEALQAAVEEPGGTGRRAQLEHFTVAGKTGTADKYNRQTKTWGERHFSSFVGFFPVERPRLCIGVFIDEPTGEFYFGGSTAGPMFRKIARQAAEYLGIPKSPARRLTLPETSLARNASAGGLTQPGRGSRF
jgi:cell division protein FtsI (penicillin-binding protein 3)